VAAGYNCRTSSSRRPADAAGSRADERGPELLGGLVAASAAGFALAVALGVGWGSAALVCAAALALAAMFAVGAWARSRTLLAQARAAAAEAGTARGEDRERLEGHIRRLEAQRAHERQLLERLRQSWKAEREWGRELRGQLQRAQGARDALEEREEAGDVRALVLRAAIELVGAEKGLLVSRADADGDGALDVVHYHGFEHDPTHSAVAQRFARAVLARDEIIRDDDPPEPSDSEATRSDREIDTLVAIPLYLRDRFHGVIVCANRPDGFAGVGDELLLALGDHAGVALQSGRLAHELRDARRAVVRVLAEAVAARDPVLHRETSELAIHAGLLGDELAIDHATRDVLICATLLRAVGHLPLPERVILRPGPLTPEERALVELHPRIGFNVLGQAPALRDAARVVLHHHERYDGTGYPAGLAGDEIPLAARVLAVLEAYGAMTHERPYREPLPVDEACEALVEGAGTQFDPEIVALFVEQVRRRPRLTRDDVSATLLEALPLDLGQADGAAVDGATLLGTRHQLHEDMEAARRHDVAVCVVLLELSELPSINAEQGHRAGDRHIEQAARAIRRAAARLGGTAYRVSGRRFAILARVRGGELLPGRVDDVRTEFLDGPRVEVVAVLPARGEPAEAVLARARAELQRIGTP
jgi:HD-GYP domain-containing protein (c-di-GMP phosphodiesterase class II)